MPHATDSAGRIQRLRRDFHFLIDAHFALIGDVRLHHEDGLASALTIRFAQSDGRAERTYRRKLVVLNG